MNMKKRGVEHLMSVCMETFYLLMIAPMRVVSIVYVIA